MTDMCTDNRFEVIEKYKQKLIECTNIETAKDEMAVIDNILFRFWQMGWLPSAHPDLDEWCNTCREYDSDRHCCPRWNRVIRETVEEVKKDRINCAHCKRYDRHGHRCKWWNHGVSNVDWCSYAERRTDG